MKTSGTIEWCFGKEFEKRYGDEVTEHKISNFMASGECEVLFQDPAPELRARTISITSFPQDLQRLFVPHPENEWGRVEFYEYESGALGEDSREHYRGTLFYRRAHQ